MKGSSFQEDKNKSWLYTADIFKIYKGRIDKTCSERFYILLALIDQTAEILEIQ